MKIKGLGADPCFARRPQPAGCSYTTPNSFSSDRPLMRRIKQPTAIITDDPGVLAEVLAARR